DQRPQRDERDVRAEPHALHDRAGDQRRGDDGKCSLVREEENMRNRPVGVESDAAQKKVFAAAAPSRCVAECDRIAEESPHQADEAGTSTGNVYHHFPDKEAIFRTLLDEFWMITDSKRYPYTRVLSGGGFPENLEQLGLAARDSVREFRSYIALIYVDVIEFDG